MNSMAENIVKIKESFVKNYTGKSHVHEILPTCKTDFLPIDTNHLTLLHNFLENNPIYSNSFESEFCGIRCKIFEGDLSQFWIDSIKHDTSYAPFYPTWLLSAYMLALDSKRLGFSELVDIGSGDGRIAFCGKIVGLECYSIEIDEQLTSLQNQIKQNISNEFIIFNQDATQVNYEILNFKQPIFFIGGLPENGEILAESIIKNILELHKLKNNSCFVLTGTLAKRKFSINRSNYGWDLTTKKFSLKNIHTVFLPTYWTMDQQIETPYIFTKHI
jgi:hypothetical protein